jgi:hypothetical protein
MSAWTWVVVGALLWVLAGLMVSLVIGLLVRARDLPTSRHLAELRPDTLAQVRTIHAAHNDFADDRSATSA